MTNRKSFTTISSRALLRALDAGAGAEACRDEDYTLSLGRQAIEAARAGNRVLAGRLCERRIALAEQVGDDLIVSYYLAVIRKLAPETMQ